MKKIAIMGGAFDPPHDGHLMTARTVLTYLPEYEQVYWTPCGQHVFGKDMTAAEHRLEMCRLAAARDNRIQPFSYEIDEGLTGETYKFARALRSDKLYADLDFAFVIGMDNANCFDKWYEAEKLAAEFKFIVLSREGFNPDPKVDWYTKKPHVFINVPKPLPALGSRNIRPMIAAGDYGAASDHLDSKVLDYILKHGLYMNKS